MTNNKKKSRREMYSEQFVLTEVIDDPFAMFSEWTADAGEKAYAKLTAWRRKDKSTRGKSRKSNLH